MWARVLSCAVVGLEGELVEAEVDIANGLPAFHVVGLPDASVQEARERVRAAVRNSGHRFPGTRITANLAPADLKKEGPSYDLPIAVGILIASEQAPPLGEPAVLVGELSLDGAVRHTPGILPMVAVAREKGIRTVFVPAADAKEAALVQGVIVMPVETLAEMAAHLRGERRIQPYEPGPMPYACDIGPETGAGAAVDFAHIRGQEHAKRAMEVAAAGSHNLVLSGPPGSGKTLLARALPGILPRMTPQEMLDVTKIYSVSGLLPTDTPLMIRRPFRSPHYTISHAGLVGGGRGPRPGEISLAHRGVLFLDELPEFARADLEALRQPMEDRVVTISRAQGSITFPANFMLVGAMNPCPCGFFGDLTKPCTCAMSLVTRYQKRISGPLMDRVDIFIPAPRVDYDKLASDTLGEPSAAVRARVEAARDRQRARFAGTHLMCNADMSPVEVREFCVVDQQGHALLRTAMKQLNLSARAFHRTLKLARTIADLAESQTIAVTHIAEAIQYRPRDLGG
ncbi:MAG: YifB family Mg chelatase-like AAA ATPase [Chloroflexi bacterium]|nr:YifB family Mg chelatase-like AAA ATPase [Chloroflexota bacterium]